MTTTLDTLRQLNVITSAGRVNKQAKRMLDQRPDVVSQLVEATSFLYESADVVTRVRCVLHGVTTQPQCIQCGRDLVPLRYKHDKHRFVHMCQNTAGSSCAASNAGVQERRTATLVSRYGVTNPAHSAEVRSKVKQTNTERYGGVAPACSPDVKNKIKRTVANRTDEERDAIIQRRKQTFLSTTGSTSHAQSQLQPDVIERINKYSYDPDWLYDQHVTQGKTLTEIAEFIGVTVSVISQRFQRLNVDVVKRSRATAKGSAEEQQLLEFVRSLVGGDIEIHTNDRTVIPPRELDIYIPRYNIAIEYCGIFWHGETRGRNRSYHAEKYRACAERGVRLIQVWSSEWLNNRELVKSRLSSILHKNALTLYARKCKVKQISPGQADVFFASNHIQGKCSAAINYGLFNDDVQLVAVMSFGKDRFSKSQRYELIRFAVAQRMSIVGGASKLFKAFCTDYRTEVVSYSDNRWNTGAVYKQLGFTQTHTSQPNYFYFDTLGDTNKLFSRIQFQKHKLSLKLEVFDPTLTEWENMRLNGYDRIWDCGNTVWVWKP